MQKKDKNTTVPSEQGVKLPVRGRQLKRPYQRMPVVRRKRNGINSNPVPQRGMVGYL